MADFCVYVRSVLYNGLGRQDAARAAQRVFERQPVGYGPLVVSEQSEAAARAGDVALVRAALEFVSERARVTPTEWALGIEARVRALLSNREAADSCYRESINYLGRTRPDSSRPASPASGATALPASRLRPPERSSIGGQTCRARRTARSSG